MSSPRMGALSPRDLSLEAPAASPQSPSIHYSGMSLPEPLMKFLQELDANGTGCVSQEDFDRVSHALQPPTTSGCSPKSKRTISPRSAVSSPKARQGRFSGLTPKTLRTFDFDGDGSVGTHDLELAQHLDTMAKQNRRRDMCIIGALLASLIVLAAAMFGVSFAAVELSKEVHASSHGVLETSTGELVRVGSADMKILGGTLFEQGPEVIGQCNNRTGECAPLLEGGYSHALATRTAEELRFLNSRTADDIFRNLDKISLALRGHDGISMNMTLKVHGFMRTRSNTNECGSVVRLDVLHGTVIIDGSDIHFDRRLLQHFEAQGVMSLASGPASIFGRRLASQQALVLGIFTFFEDYECECFNVTEPVSPKLPYAATLLEKRPCLTPEMCQSKIFSGQYLPGYDAASDSILTIVTVVVAEEFSITTERFPNHPVQEAITVTKHAAHTTERFQMSAERVTRCYNETYTPMQVLGVDAWYAVYLGESSQEGQLYEFLGENFTTQSGTRRQFQLQLKNASVDSEPVDYDDDAETLFPQRMFLHSARSEEWDIEEVLTIELQELDAVAAADILAEYEAMLVCEGQTKSFPLMRSAYEESIHNVVFYAEDLQTNPDAGIATDNYWGHAITAVDQVFLDDYHTWVNATVANATMDRRRLLRRRLASRGFRARFDDKNSLEVAVDADTSGHVCVGVVGSSGGDTGWSVSGELSMGDNCGSQPGNFAVSGSVQVGYTWGVQKKLLGYRIGCSLTVWGSIGGNVGSFGYDCGRRLEEEGDDNTQDGKALAIDDDDEVEDVEDVDDLEADAIHVSSSLQNSSSELMDGDDDEEDEDAPEGMKGRRLFWGRRRRRRSRRRRRTCYSPGVEIDAGIGIDGGCSAGVSVGVSGSLDINIGPFPQPPLDAEITGALSAKACINLVFASGCVGIGSFDLFEIDI